MAQVESPLHGIRLLVVAAVMAFMWLLAADGFHGSTVAVLGILISLAVYTWLAVQPAQHSLADGALTGALLGVGVGSLMGYGAYLLSDFCFVMECARNGADFWIWFVPIFLGQTLIGLAVGSLAAGKDKPIPGMEDLPPVRR